MHLRVCKLKQAVLNSQEGTVIYLDGSKYLGQLLNGKRHGQVLRFTTGGKDRASFPSSAFERSAGRSNDPLVDRSIERATIFATKQHVSAYSDLYIFCLYLIHNNFRDIISYQMFVFLSKRLQYFRRTNAILKNVTTGKAYFVKI